MAAQTQDEANPADRSADVLPDGIPLESIKWIYELPQERWGRDEWRALALYLNDELSSATALVQRLADGTDRANQALASACESLRKARLHRRFLGTLEAAIADGSLKVEVVPPKKKPGPKRKPINRMRFYAINELYRREGSKLAKRMAAHDTVPGKRWEDLVLGTGSGWEVKAKQHLKTWQNEISLARAFEVPVEFRLPAGRAYAALEC